ncbi:PAS domain-containing sensor histidine kinase [Massilia cavernae]|uniref:histidine kinase n=1 Tax=Massilia cavernae TaxID=2320864 RepID=A0A418Y5D2_9BURK|nr:ATP-binding protein [Massilia cavernae]RJG21691.1 PAS domain-containing sensor histidine kinase [Massilia cavernae]
MSSSNLADHFRTIAELRGDVAWIVDCATGLPGYISPHAGVQLGYALPDFHDQLAHGGDGPLAELCGGLAERLRRFAEGDQSRLRLVREFELPRGDGDTSTPVEVTSMLVLDDQGEPHRLVGTIRDLSAQRAVEAGQRSFASMLNHEFRTPLSTIDGAIQRLEATGADADEPTRQRYRKIAMAVDRMAAMLDQYLSPDRIASTGHKPRDNHAEPRRLLEEGAGIARAAGRSATVSGDGLPGAIRCAPDGLRLAIRVLVENAVQYSPEDSVIELAGAQTADGIELLVRDHGPGVPTAETGRIFDRFYRGSNAGSRPGSGLGLYMARSVVDVHGGSLSVRNLDNRGAEFRLWLPLQGVGKKVARGKTNSDNRPLDEMSAPGWTQQ